MKVKAALWILSFLLGGMAWPAGAQIALANGLAGPARAVAAADGMCTGGLTFEERVAYQRAIEEVYWRHRIWPKENLKPKPALDQVMPAPVLHAKVEDDLRKSQALGVYWQRPITGEQLQAAMDRMARQTKQPAMLAELWAALGNGPYVIADCLARSALANRSIRIGEYVFQGFGNVLVDGVNQPIVLMGHYTSDGKGNWVRGRGTTVQNGVTSHRTFTATYTIEPNCHGTYDGITEEGVPFYGELEVHSDGEEGVAIRTIPGQTIIFPNKRSK